MEKFGEMLTQFQQELRVEFHVHQFLCYHMRRIVDQPLEETIKSLRYPPKNRTILHQLTEDDKLHLIKDVLTLNQD